GSGSRRTPERWTRSKDLETTMAAFHAAAEAYPLMPDDELSLLVEDMKANGFDPHFPIARFKDQILDGRNRQRAADLAEVNPTYIDLPEDTDPEKYVERANEHRRHLTQKWLEVRRRERIERVAEARRNGDSIRTIAEAEKVCPATIQE